MKNKIYTCELSENLLPGVGGGSQFLLNNANREMQINSVFLDVSIWDIGIGSNRIPLEQNTRMPWDFSIDSEAFGGNKFAQSFGDFAVPGAVANNGGMIRFYNIGKFDFSSFYLSSVCAVTFNIINRDLLVSYGYSASIAIEITEL